MFKLSYFYIFFLTDCFLENIDPSGALGLPGVVGFLNQDDISGENNFSLSKPWKEEIFAAKKVLYAGQAVGKNIKNIPILNHSP